jgi:hypothetical protein
VALILFTKLSQQPLYQTPFQIEFFTKPSSALSYQPPASSTFLSEQTNHQQPASDIFLSEQINTRQQPNKHGEEVHARPKQTRQ